MANELTKTFDAKSFTDDNGYTNLICAIGNNILDLGGGSSQSALRFTSLEVAKNTTFNFAKLILPYSSVGDSGTWKWKLRGIDQDDCGSFSGSEYGYDRTSAEVNINEGEPTSGGTKTIDIDSILEEIVSRSGWSSGNDIGFIFSNEGSDSSVWANFNTSTLYIAYRVSAEPDFTPTPTTISAPSIPTPGDYGIKISQPGVSVLEATEAQTYYNSGKRRFKVFSEGAVTTSANPHTIAHNLGYIPFAEVFKKVGDEWFRLPFMNYSGGSNIGYMSIDDTNLNIYAGSGQSIYYYIFLDELAS